MKTLDVIELETIEGGKLIDVFDGICGGVSVGGAAVAVGVRLALLAVTTGGTGLIVATAACAGYGAWRLFS